MPGNGTTITVFNNKLQEGISSGDYLLEVTGTEEYEPDKANITLQPGLRFEREVHLTPTFGYLSVKVNFISVNANNILKPGIAAAVAGAQCGQQAVMAGGDFKQ